MDCETCQYCIEHRGEKFCAYYCQFLDVVCKLKLCPFLDYRKEDERLQRMSKPQN